MSATVPRIAHIHIPKTAGTALRDALARRFKDQARIFPHYLEPQFANVRPEDYDFFSGHIGFETAKRLNCRLITVLRHPIDRFVSVYFFWRQLYEQGVERSRNTTLANRYSLDAFADLLDQPMLIEEFSNRMTWQLAGGSSSSARAKLRLEGCDDDAIYRMGCDNLETIDIVGFQEDLPRLSAALNAVFDLRLDIGRVNTTLGRVDYQSVPISTRQKIYRWVYMDLELYLQAQRRDMRRTHEVGRAGGNAA